jgi:hypothetical protein
MSSTCSIFRTNAANRGYSVPVVSSVATTRGYPIKMDMGMDVIALAAEGAIKF